ncbi:MAG: hypothetical protein IPK63_09745 [Candidatus Competibacteraceae bacterium]|nr:hypothetical protein [Candidatus Competibacteraceae bacterium]
MAAALPSMRVALKPIEQAAGLVGWLWLLIGNDIGRLNMAAASRAPAVGLFGDSPSSTHSRHIHAILPPAGETGMAAITASQVVEALDWLNQPDETHNDS